LEILFVREVMRKNIVALPASATVADLTGSLHTGHERRGQLLYPVVDENGMLAGTVTRNKLSPLLEGEPQDVRLAELVEKNPVVAYADEPLRVVVNRMAETGYTRFPVVEREDDRKLVGMVALHDLLQARTRVLHEERRRERVLRIHLPFGPRGSVTETHPA
jgi:chloride channel protein, CIC family